MLDQILEIRQPVLGAARRFAAAFGAFGAGGGFFMRINNVIVYLSQFKS